MPYHCIVIAREVWDTRDLLANVADAAGGLNEDSLTRRYEPEDLNSLEQALQIKDQHGGKVTVLSVGPSRDVDVLRESLFRGVDQVIRIIPGDGPLDTQAQAQLLAAAVRKVGEFDLVMIGVSVPDGENSLLGAELAALLGVEQIGYVDTIGEVAEDGVLCKREIEMGNEYIRAPLPAVLVLGVYLLKDDPRTPRSAKAMLKLKMKKVPIPEWTAAELGVAATPKVTVARYQAVPPRVVETKDVDPEDAGALKAMLQEIQ